jgi:uncharacterized membrane protein YjjP (DUF1212 family)
MTDPLDPLALAADAGRFVLEAGGETYRAEETVVTLCRVWRYADPECFATPTGLMASVGEAGVSRSVVRRIKNRAVDLRRIARLAAVVELAELAAVGPDEFRDALAELDRDKPTPYPLVLLAAAGCAGAFSLLYGGVWRDALAGSAVGVAIKLAADYVRGRRIPDFIVNIVGGAVATALSAAAVGSGLAVNLDKTVIGAIMQLVPGLATVNAIRDTIAGDLVAGVARLADAFMAAAAISLGAGAGLALVRALGLGV